MLALAAHARRPAASGLRAFATGEVERLAGLLSQSFRKEDPTFMGADELKRFLNRSGAFLAKKDRDGILKQSDAVRTRWREIFEQRMHDGVELAPAGELSDGELPSWSRANLAEAGFAEATEVDPDHVESDAEGAAK